MGNVIIKDIMTVIILTCICWTIGSVAPQQKGFLLDHSSDRFHETPSLLQFSVLFALIKLWNAYGLENKEISLIADA